jgi:glycosyltransferase involved in cell wall biosynthesis
MTTPRLSIITACYNHARYLTECVGSVMRQTCREIEQLVVIDGATDHSFLVASACAAADPRVRILLNPENRGLAFSQNRGISEARAPWVLKVDADDYIAPTYVEEILQAADADTRRNVIFSPCQHVGAQTHVYRYEPFDPARMIDQLIIPGPAAFRRATWDAVGGYDETMRSAEDWDLYVRAQLVVGLVPHQLPTPRWYYRMHDGPRASARGMAQLPDLQAYWRGHTRESALGRTRNWGAWCAQRGIAA